MGYNDDPDADSRRAEPLNVHDCTTKVPDDMPVKPDVGAVLSVRVAESMRPVRGPIHTEEVALRRAALDLPDSIPQACRCRFW